MNNNQTYKLINKFIYNQANQIKSIKLLNFK